MTFVQELENDVHEKLASLDLLKEPKLGPVDRSEIVRRLKMALKNELEASEIAARRAAIPGGGHGRHDSHETCRQAAKLIEHLCALILDDERSFDYCW